MNRRPGFIRRSRGVGVRAFFVRCWFMGERKLRSFVGRLSALLRLALKLGDEGDVVFRQVLPVVLLGALGIARIDALHALLGHGCSPPGIVWSRRAPMMPGCQGCGSERFPWPMLRTDPACCPDRFPLGPADDTPASSDNRAGIPEPERFRGPGLRS